MQVLARTGGRNKQPNSKLTMVLIDHSRTKLSIWVTAIPIWNAVNEVAVQWPSQGCWFLSSLLFTRVEKGHPKCRVPTENLQRKYRALETCGMSATLVCVSIYLYRLFDYVSRQARPAKSRGPTRWTVSTGEEASSIGVRVHV